MQPKTQVRTPASAWHPYEGNNLHNLCQGCAEKDSEVHLGLLVKRAMSDCNVYYDQGIRVWAERGNTGEINCHS